MTNLPRTESTDDEKVKTVATTAGSSAAATTALSLLQQSGITVLTGDYRGWTNRMKIAGATGNEYTVSLRISTICCHRSSRTCEDISGALCVPAICSAVNAMLVDGS